MTEEEWLTGTDPEPMLEFLRHGVNERKLRLFECACCRHIWHLIPPYHRRTVEVAERFADGLATVKELHQSYQITRETPENHEGDFDPAGEGNDYDPFIVPWPSQATTATAFSPGGWDELDASYWSAELAAWTRPKQVYREERKAQTHLLRDICGNPFRPVAREASWVAWEGGTIQKLAFAAYEEHCFESLPVLADALEDAGCTNADILSHLRGPGPHVRGCWVLDLILGKS